MVQCKIAPCDTVARRCRRVRTPCIECAPIDSAQGGSLRFPVKCVHGAHVCGMGCRWGAPIAIGQAVDQVVAGIFPGSRLDAVTGAILPRCGWRGVCRQRTERWRVPSCPMLANLAIGVAARVAVLIPWLGTMPGRLSGYMALSPGRVTPYGIGIGVDADDAVAGARRAVPIRCCREVSRGHGVRGRVRSRHAAAQPCGPIICQVAGWSRGFCRLFFRFTGPLPVSR